MELVFSLEATDMPLLLHTDRLLMVLGGGVGRAEECRVNSTNELLISSLSGCTRLLCMRFLQGLKACQHDLEWHFTDTFLALFSRSDLAPVKAIADDAEGRICQDLWRCADTFLTLSRRSDITAWKEIADDEGDDAEDVLGFARNRRAPFPERKEGAAEKVVDLWSKVKMLTDEKLKWMQRIDALILVRFLRR